MKQGDVSCTLTSDLPLDPVALSPRVLTNIGSFDICKYSSESILSSLSDIRSIISSTISSGPPVPNPLLNTCARSSGRLILLPTQCTDTRPVFKASGSSSVVGIGGSIDLREGGPSFRLLEGVGILVLGSCPWRPFHAPSHTTNDNISTKEARTTQRSFFLCFIRQLKEFSALVTALQLAAAGRDVKACALCRVYVPGTLSYCDVSRRAVGR